VVSVTGRDFLGFLRRSGVPAKGPPRIYEIEPAAGRVGSKVIVRGSNLAGSRIYFGGEPARKHASRLSNAVSVVVPDVSGTVKVDAANALGRSRTRATFQVIPPDTYGAFTFRGDAISHGGVGHSIATSGTNQPYLILVVLPSDLDLPAGTAEADVITNVQAQLDEANNYWQEVSFDNTSFSFDLHPNILRLLDPFEDYYRESAPKTLLGSGVTYPVTWAGGEMLELTGDDGFEATVTFPAGEQTLGEVRTEIDNAITAAWTEPGDPPIVVSAMGGQIQLSTSREASDAVLETAGTAESMLGFDDASVTVTEGVDKVDDDYKKIRDALVARVDGMSDQDAKNYLSSYDGVAVVFAQGTLRASASIGAWNFDVRDEQYSFSNFNIDSTYPWEVYAHEIGHNLGFPDLYDEPGGVELVGEEPGNWDMMHCSWCDAHTSAWIKHHKTASSSAQWMTSVESMMAPPGNTTNQLEVLLAPASSELPASNPFAASHPGIPFRQAVQIVVSDDRSLYVENRQPSFSSPDFGDTTYDDDVPSEGVIVTDTVNTMDGLPVYRSWVIMATPGNDPLDVVGEEEIVLDVTPTNKVRVRILEKLGSAPAVYLVRVTWGQGSYFDYRLRDWDPPPWESADIWIDTRVDNEWDEYTHSDASANPDVQGNPVLNGDRSRVGWPSRVYARVWNDGDIARNNVRVRFQVVVPAGIGPVPGFDVGEDFIDLPAGGFELAQVDWTPRDANEGHVCIRAMVDHDPDELNANNNMAQENITDWYLEGSSPYVPVSFPYQVANPLPRRALFRMHVKGLRPGWYTRVDPVQFWLEPDEVMRGHATVMADSSVPFEDILLREEADVPIISVESQVKYNDAWAAFGGISGTAHPVRASRLGVDLDPYGEGVHVAGSAHTADGPVGGANVSLRLLARDALTEIDTTRTSTASDGSFHQRIEYPDRSESYYLEVVLSPGVGTGPAAWGPAPLPPADGDGHRPVPPIVTPPSVAVAVEAPTWRVTRGPIIGDT